MQKYKPNRLAPHGPPDASQTIALKMTWSKLLLNYTSLLIQPLMVGISSIFNKNYPNYESNHGHYVWNTKYISTSTLEVPTAKVCWLHSCKQWY